MRIAINIKVLTIDETGKPTVLEYDSSRYAGGGFFTYTEKHPGFEQNVRFFMELLLRENTYEFKLLRDSLNQEYRQMAEEVRKESMNRYDF